MKKVRNVFIGLSKKTATVLTIMAMVLCYLLPTTVVHADTVYVISFTAIGTHTMEKENAILVK